MGDIIKSFSVRSAAGEKSRRLRLYFDSGSPYTFVKQSACRGFSNLLKLAKPEPFSGLGDGSFRATHLLNGQVCLLGIWCRHPVYVVQDSVFEEGEDMLVGHDFMQKFNLRLHLKRRDVIADRDSLKRAQKVRTACGESKF